MNLTADETLALVTFARHVLRADGRVTDAELLYMMDLARDIGLERFSVAFERSSHLPPLSASDFEELARLIRKPELRWRMMEHLVALAQCDGLVESERTLLRKIASCWGLSIHTFLPQGEQDHYPRPVQAIA